MRSIIITASILAIALFVISWISFPYIISQYIDFFGRQSGIQVSMQVGEGWLRIYASTVMSIAILPVLSGLATVAASKLKNQPLHRNLFFTYFMIITLGYLLGVVVKFLYVLYLFRQLDSFVIPNVISVSIDQIIFYQDGFYISVIAAIVAVIFTKKKEAEKAAVYGN